MPWGVIESTMFSDHFCIELDHFLSALGSTFPLIFFLQLHRPATALSRKFLHDLTTARHFKSFFIICIIRIFTMKIEKFQLRGNNSVCVGAFQLLRDRAPTQLRGNNEWHVSQRTSCSVTICCELERFV
jgi:hypothetical protein